MNSTQELQQFFMDLIKEIQTKFMEMTSEFSSLFKHIQQLHTQFSEKEKPKIRLASHLEQISSKWLEYKNQIKDIEKKKQFLEKMLVTRSDQLIKQKYRERLLIMKINKLEEMIKGFLGGSFKIMGKEIQLPSGEKLILEEDNVVLDSPQYVETRSNVFSKALYNCTIKIYNIVHDFVQFNIDFKPHEQFLKQMEKEMDNEWKSTQTETKCTIQFEHRKLKSMVDQCYAFQSNTIQELQSLRRKVTQNDIANQNWELLGKSLERTERKVTQKTKIQNNYQKIIKGERIMIERVLNTPDIPKKLGELCRKQKDMLACEKINTQEELFKDELVKYVNCFKDLLGAEQQDYQSSLNSLKMIVLHQTNLITSLNNDILRIQVEIEVRKKAIEEGLRVIFNQMYNQIYEKQTPHRSFIKSERMDRSIGNIPLAYGHKRNESNNPSSSDKMNNSNILGDLDIKGDFSKKEVNSSEEKKVLYKKVSRKPSIKVNQKFKDPHSSEVVDSQKPKAQVSKLEMSEVFLPKQPPMSHNSLSLQIKGLLESNKQSEVQEAMKAYLKLINKAISEQKQIECNLNQMLDFIKGNFPQQSSYYQPFKDLGYTDTVGKLKLIYEIPFELNVYPPSIRGYSEDVIKQELSENSKEVERKPYFLNYDNSMRSSSNFMDVGTQTQMEQQSPPHPPTWNFMEKEFRIFKSLEVEITPSKISLEQKLQAPVPSVSQSVQNNEEDHHEAFTLNEKIKISTQLIEKKQEIIELKVFRQKFLQLQKIHEICIENQAKYDKIISEQEERQKLFQRITESLKEFQKKCGLLQSEREFLVFELKNSEEQKNQRILREQDFIKQVLLEQPVTLGQNISRELEEKIIFLMNKLVNLNRNLSDSMDQMQLSSMKITEDIDTLKHFVCLRLNSTLQAITKDDIPNGDILNQDKKRDILKE